jgi:hypothetical protein
MSALTPSRHPEGPRPSALGEGSTDVENPLPESTISNVNDPPLLTAVGEGGGGVRAGSGNVAAFPC